MARDWRCRLNIHRYKEKRNDVREVYWECTRCGHQKFPEQEGNIANWPGSTGMPGM